MPLAAWSFSSMYQKAHLENLEAILNMLNTEGVCYHRCEFNTVMILIVASCYSTLNIKFGKSVTQLTETYP